MGYTRLNISDVERGINSEVHGHLGDALVVALAAATRTIEALGLMWLSNSLV